MKNQKETLKKNKIEELKLLLKEKQQTISIAKQKAGFFARKCAELEEKLEGKTKPKVLTSRKQARKYAKM